MPRYEYECLKCDLHFETTHPIADLDNIDKIKEKYCPHSKTNIAYNKDIVFVDIELPEKCELRRIPTSGYFKI
jgi:hypothetical protein